MPETAVASRRVVLARRPRGAPVPDDLRLEEGPPPVPTEGEALVRTVWLSLACNYPHLSLSDQCLAGYPQGCAPLH